MFVCISEGVGKNGADTRKGRGTHDATDNVMALLEIAVPI